MMKVLLPLSLVAMLYGGVVRLWADVSTASENQIERC